MDIGVISACLLLLGLCGYFVARPLLTLQNATAGDVSVRQLNERKEQIYASIIELTFDNELGKLPDADFQRMRGELESQALSILEQLDQRGQQSSGGDIEQRIEREIVALQRQTEHPDLPRVEPRPEFPPTPPMAAAKFCGQCGTARRGADRFCTQCGTAFEEAA